MMIARFGHRILEESEYTCEHAEIYARAYASHDDASTHLLHAHAAYADAAEFVSLLYGVSLRRVESNMPSIEKQIQPGTVGRV